MIISIDGINGSGKTTQAALIVNKFREEFPDRAVYALCDPGVARGNPAYDKIRPLARFSDWGNPMTRMMLYQAARCELIHTVRELQKDDPEVIIILDRYAAAYYAYAIEAFSNAYVGGAARGRANITELLKICGAFIPDLTMLIFIDVKTAMERWKKISGNNPDVFEQGGKAELTRLNGWYTDITKHRGDYPFVGKRVLEFNVVDMDIDKVHDILWPVARGFVNDTENAWSQNFG